MKRLVPLLLLAACRPENLSATLPPDVRVDTYAQQAASKIDVLWVVDNSGSMAARQENLAKNFQSFIGIFSRGQIDFRLAVTTSNPPILLQSATPLDIIKLIDIPAADRTSEQKDRLASYYRIWPGR